MRWKRRRNLKDRLWLLFYLDVTYVRIDAFARKSNDGSVWLAIAALFLAENVHCITRLYHTIGNVKRLSPDEIYRAVRRLRRDGRLSRHHMVLGGNGNRSGEG